MAEDRGQSDFKREIESKLKGKTMVNRFHVQAKVLKCNESALMFASMQLFGRMCPACLIYTRVPSHTYSIQKDLGVKQRIKKAENMLKQLLSSQEA